MKLSLKIFLLFFICALSTPFFVVAEELETTCAQISESTSGCPGLSSADCNALLKKCVDYYDEQSAKLSNDITKTSQQKNTLSNQISTVQKKIQNISYQINQSNIQVKGLNVQIDETQKSVNETSVGIQDSKNKIINILRSIYQEDKKPAIEILLEGNLSDFFSNLAYLESLNAKVSDLLENTKDLKVYLEDQQVKMDDEVDQLQKTIALQSLQKQENEINKKQQETYLQLTEAQYQQQLQDKQDLEEKSAKIKAMLFQTVGISKAPTFGEALDIAKMVGSTVGIRPAFLLAIISQESAIGRNVGQCYLTDPSTGAGQKISTGATIIRVMKPTRDVPPFLEITKASGRDPYATPVSCWIPAYVGGLPYGWGGAMGPAQFIASTWMLFEDELEQILGRPADPWAIRDSFTASGLYLADLGASKQTASAENTAAGRYYGQSGAYNTGVMTRAACIQTFIDDGTMSSYCQNLIF